MMKKLMKRAMPAPLPTSTTPAQRSEYYDSEEFKATQKKIEARFGWSTERTGTVHKPHVNYEFKPKHHGK
jgi:hypothetical protein